MMVYYISAFSHFKLLNQRVSEQFQHKLKVITSVTGAFTAGLLDQTAFLLRF